MKGSLDLITSAGLISSQPISEYFESIRLGRLPYDLFATFLHEATHQWCLWSPVGTSLSLLNLELHRECRRDALFLLVPSAVPIQARVSTVRRVLEPLLEGMAQFAEFDLYTGTSSVTSSITEWTMTLFNHEAGELIGNDPLHRFRYLLLKFRSSDSGIRRKADMLVRPLTAERGGYLTGYLTVKNLWHSAVRRSPRLRDPDLFLTYLRSLVFEDFGLAEILLGPPTDEYVDFDRLSARVIERLKLLSRGDLDEHVRQFEAAISTGGVLDGSWESIYIDNDLVAQERETRANWMKSRGVTDQEKEGGNFKTPPAYTAGDMASLLGRTTIRIGVDEVSIEVSQGRSTVSFNGEALFSARSYPEIEEGIQKGLLSLHFVPTYKSLALVCTCEKGLVCASFFPCIEGLSVPEDERRGYAESMARVLLDDELRALLHFAVEQGDYENRESDEWESVAPKVTPAITNMYLNFALCFVSNEKLSRCHEIMEKHGFWNVLSREDDPPREKAERVRGLAALGLITSCALEESVAVHMVEELGFSYKGVVDNLLASTAESGYSIGVYSNGSSSRTDESRFVCLV